jgi:hypothetical protein
MRNLKIDQEGITEGSGRCFRRQGMKENAEFVFTSLCGLHIGYYTVRVKNNSLDNAHKYLFGSLPFRIA